jgi:hypothetical protein
MKEQKRVCSGCEAAELSECTVRPSCGKDNAGTSHLEEPSHMYYLPGPQCFRQGRGWGRGRWG